MNEKVNPLISVIVPVYNTYDYLERCVKSIACQTYENIEIILVDDGSTDGSEKLCDKLAEEITDNKGGLGKTVKVLHKENGGSSSARNLGIKNATGEYLGFVDSDDYISPEMYEELINGIRKSGAKISQVGRDEIDAAGNKLPDICTPPEKGRLEDSKDFYRELLMHRGDASFCTKLIDRELFKDRAFPVGLLNEDFRLLIEMLPECNGVYNLPYVGYHVFYRIGSNSRKESKDKFSRVFSDSVNNADYVAELVDKYYPELKDVAFRFGVFQRIEYMLHIPVKDMNKNTTQYIDIVKWLRRNYFKALGNKYLTLKNKAYVTVFALAPKSIRWVHKKIKRL
ncbi:MAG: glycosyltransferase [Acetatifactor sp.]|nr:glycosyltransferase [Acetatifactor sp.]